ncbi:glutamate racemase [Nitrosomonadales bacterium]|jgi:glutamate racemase|nr:glutamate racemase [Nitrosomonadales bacterium]
MKKIQTIGIFDSGIGGISVMSHIQRLLPDESLAYVADSLYAPYGLKNNHEILDRSKAIIDYLIKNKSAKLIVVACNTATAAAIKELRQIYEIPIIGMEPAIKPATKTTKCKSVGILATNGTLESAKFSALLETYSGEIQFYTQPCPGLVELIEQGRINDSSIKNLIQKYLDPLLERKVDTIVLGCTHYIFIKNIIKNIMGPEVNLIDTGLAVAKQVKRQLEKSSLQNQSKGKCYSISTNSSNREMEEIIRSITINSDFKFSYFDSWS